MFVSEREPLSLLLELTPKLAKQRFRNEIYKAWNYCCGYCGDKATSLDHIIPKFKSGHSNIYNLLPSCRRCNANKGSNNMETWYKAQVFFCQKKFKNIVLWMEHDQLEFKLEKFY